MSFKYKLAAAIISLPIFFLVFFFPCLQIRASAAGSDSWIERLAAYQVSKWEDLPSDFQSLAEAYVNTFNSIGTKGYFESVADIPLNWYYILDDTTPVLSVGGAVFYYLDGNGNLKYTKKGNSGSGNSIEDNATIVGSRDDLVVDGKRFKKYINDRSTYYEPTGSGYKISWANDKYFKSWDIGQEKSTVMTFLEKGSLFGLGKHQLYAMPYFESNDGVYYYQYCLFFDVKTQVTDSSGSFEIYQIDLKGVDVLNSTADLRDPAVYSSLFDSEDNLFLSMTSNVNLCGYLWIPSEYYFSSSDRFNFYFGDYGVLTDIFSVRYGSSHYSFRPVNSGKAFNFFKSDNITISNSGFFCEQAGNFKNGVRTERERQDVDWGFIVSDTPILMDGMGADIDTTKIPDNYYITVGGDTIYDYNITNPSTGDTTTINNYITNNYTYITNNPGGEGSGGSTVNNYYDGATINNGDNHYYDGATINNGDNITNNYNFSEGDTNFFTQIGVEIQNALNFAFVPSDGYMDKFNTNMRSLLESKIPFVYDMGEIFNSLFVDIVDNNLVYVSDINSDGSVDESSIIYPKWTFNVNFFGTDYELVYLDFSMYSDSLFYVRLVVACFTYLAFFVMLIRSLPGIIGNVGDLVGASYALSPYVTERFSDIKGGD